MPGTIHEWVVAGALVEREGRLLLVRNQRRGGSSDWSTPGGVIDAADGSVLAGLTREVEEETGLLVTRWEGPLYEVEAHAVDLGWRMRCEVHRAVAFEGDLCVDDPDGIVVEAAFLPMLEARSRLAECHRWVGEPLGDWLVDPWGPHDVRSYYYEVRGNTRDAFEVVRTFLPGSRAERLPHHS